MTLFRKVASTALALALSASLTGSAIAQDSSSRAEVEVVESETGAISVAIGDIEFDPVEYMLEDQTSGGEVTIQVSDTRGTAPGWTVNLSGTDFEADTFEIDNLRLLNPQVETTSTTNHPSEAAPIAQPANPVAFAPGAEIISATSGTGAGEYDIDYEAQLNVPAGTLVGDYEATLTVTLTGADLGDPEIITTRGGSRLEIPVNNTGGVLVRPTGTVSLTNMDGEEVFSADVSMGSVYARMDTVLSMPLNGSLAGQDYDVSVALTDPLSETEVTLDSEAVGFSGEVPEDAPLQIAQADIVPMPDEDDPVYVSVDLTIENTGAQFTHADVILHVHLDGELVEDFSLGTNMTIAQGETLVSQRYIPADEFTSGEWTFSVSVQTVSPQSNATTVILSQPLDSSIAVP